MNEQLQLGNAYARSSDPGTSHAAAAAVAGPEAARMEQRVLDTLRGFPGQGLTTHEIARLSGLEYGTVTPRIKPLVGKGLVVDTGTKRIPSGRRKAGIVWRAVE